MSCVLVTGSEGRIGQSLCQTLLADGKSVIAVDRNFEHAVDSTGEAPKIQLVCDLESEDSISECVNSLRSRPMSITGIVHCAGLLGDSDAGGWVTDLTQLSLDACISAYSINSLSLVKLVSELMRIEKLSNGASVVAINSIYGGVAPDFSLYEDTQLQNPIGYAGSKFAQLGIIKWLTRYYGNKLRFNCVSPGGIESKNIPKNFREKYCNKTASGVMLKVDDVIPVIEFLLGAGSASIFGQNIVVDGGFSV